MARYRKIDPRIWNDEKFRAFSDDGKLAFLFVLTHPSMTAVGAMRGTAAGLAAELGWEPARMVDAISVPITEAMLDVDPVASYIGARNFLRYNEPEGPNSVAKAWVDALDLIPECQAKRALISRCRAYLDAKSRAFRDALPDAIWDAFPVAKSDACPIQEQEQEQEPEQKKLAGSRARARKASIESPGAGGGHRTGPEEGAAQANAAAPEGSAPAAREGGDAGAGGIPAKLGAPGPAPSTATDPGPGQADRPSPVTPAPTRGVRSVAVDEDIPRRPLRVANLVDLPLVSELRARIATAMRHGVVVAKAGEETAVGRELEDICAVHGIDDVERFALTTARRQGVDVGSLAWVLTIARDMPAHEEPRPPSRFGRWGALVEAMTPEQREEFEAEKEQARQDILAMRVWSSEQNRLLDAAEERLWAKWNPMVARPLSAAGGV